MAKLQLPIAIQGVHQTKLKSPGKLVKTFQAYLPDDSLRTYSCIHCRAQLASHDELISKVCTLYETFGVVFSKLQ